MGLFWDFYWPILTAGMIVGLCAGWIAFKRNRRLVLAAGAAITIAIALLWHFAGTGDRFADRVETRANDLARRFRNAGGERDGRSPPVAAAGHACRPGG